VLTGLRGRLAALLVLVCAVTLGICALALLRPLERLLIKDELSSLARDARQGTPALAAAAGQPPHPSRALTKEARRLERRSGMEVAVVDAGGRVLATSDPDRSGRFDDAVLALRENRVIRTTAVIDGESEARVALPTHRGFAVAVRTSLSGVRSAASVVRRAFVVAAAVSLAVALLLGIALAGRIVRRLRRLRDTALTVAKLGPLAEFEPDGGRDEVGDLTRAFATMQRNLREQEAARRAFVATASHELRTPLTSLRVMLDGARGDLEAPRVDLEHARAAVEQADAQAERLSNLTSDLLDLSRIDAGVPLRSELFELIELARSAQAELDVRARAAGRPVAVVPSSSCWAVGDPASAAQILRILLDNALRHGGGPVTVAVERRNGSAAVVVHDDGPGVPPADRERIFARFERGASTNPGPGFGLGLAIGRDLAHRMGGELDLDLDACDGAGACFVLTLPRVPDP
jgi:signal transduction histidine kinase